MIEDATSWLAALQARGATVTVGPTGRLRLHPARAYAELSDEELLFLRHNRESIKEAVRHGPQEEEVHEAAHPQPEAVPVRDVEKPAPCPCCRRTPCIGAGHPAFLALHPIEAQRHADEIATKTMMARVGKPRPWDYY